MTRSFFLLLITLFFKHSSAQDTCITTLPYGNSPKAGAFAKVNGISMYYEIYGPTPAPPLLLIHGNGGKFIPCAAKSSTLKISTGLLLHIADMS